MNSTTIMWHLMSATSNRVISEAHTQCVAAFVARGNYLSMGMLHHQLYKMDDTNFDFQHFESSR